MTESFEPYRPESSYELDYDDEPERGRPGRVLWGRVAILGIAMLLVFLLGRATGGSDGIPESRFAEVAAERDDLRAEVADLNAELDEALRATPPPATAAPSDDPGTDETATDPEGETEGGETYVVKANDTLASIAEDFYQDASLDDFLAEANGITDPTSLSVGTELIIPPKPEE